MTRDNDGYSCENGLCENRVSTARANELFKADKPIVCVECEVDGGFKAKLTLDQPTRYAQICEEQEKMKKGESTRALPPRHIWPASFLEALDSLPRLDPGGDEPSF